MSKILKCKDLPYSRYEIANLKSAADEFKNSFAVANNAEAVENAYRKYLAEEEKYGTFASLAYTRYTLNTKDEFYIGEQNYYDEVGPIAASISTEIGNLMLDSPFRAELELRFPETFFKNLECARRSHNEKIVRNEQEENAIVTEYSMLMSTIEVEWCGEKKPLSYVRGFMDDGDREVRKAACEAIGVALGTHKAQLDDIYDRLVKVRTRIAKDLGYKNFIEVGYARMGRIDYNEEMVKSFRQNVLNDIVPIVVKLKKQIAANLGINDFKFYDDGVTDCRMPKPYPSGEEILLAAKEMYHEMNDFTGKFFDKMLATEAFDTTARDGKWGGGYATTFDCFKQAFILANFNGSSGDVDVVTHEFGHTIAFDFAMNREDRSVGIGSSETAETHSMSMEFLAWKFMDKFFHNADEYKYKHLSDSLSFIPYGVIVDEFQHIVYENPDMTPAERDAAYLDLEKKYRPYLSFDGIPYLEQGTRWQYQMHIYETPFYYIDYCLAQVIALEFLALSQKNYDEALKRYLDHCKRGGLYPFGKLVKLAGLRSPFEKGALAEVTTDVEKILTKLKSNIKNAK